MVGKKCNVLILIAATLAGMELAGPIAKGQAAAGNGTTPAKIQPYTAEFRITTVKTLGNGTTITRETKMVKARDSQGRTLTETTNIPASGDQPGATLTQVQDPVARTSTSWSSQPYKQVAVRKQPTTDQRHGCWADADGMLAANYDGHPATQRPAQSPPLIEDLGMSTIDGVKVSGRRVTRTTPTGQIGNSGPLVSTNEDWQARSLNLDLRYLRDDPENGKTTGELVNLSLTEPDASMFQPPADYPVTNIELHQVPCP